MTAESGYIQKTLIPSSLSSSEGSNSIVGCPRYTTWTYATPPRPIPPTPHTFLHAQTAQVHPPADCAACVVDVVFLSLQTELGHDAVQVATAPSAEAFWWEHPPNDTKVYSRTNLDSSGLRVRGLPGMAVFVRLLSDEVVEEAGFVATARVIDTSKHIAGASTSNCYDAEGDQACSGQGECVPGKAEGQFGMCMCKAGFFGRTCLDSVCDRVNIAPTLPRWTMVRDLTAAEEAIF